MSHFAKSIPDIKAPSSLCTDSAAQPFYSCHKSLFLERAKKNTFELNWHLVSITYYMMKTHSALLFTTLLVLSTTQAAVTCGHLFAFRDPFIKQALPENMSKSAALAVKSLTNSTTGARIESKWTLETPKIESLISDLTLTLKDKNVDLKARDKVVEGKKNVTHTVYLEKFSLNLQKSGLEVGPDFNLKDVTLKVRIRKYGTIDNTKSIAENHIDFAAFTQNHSFVEFKFPDARFKGAVFKPRMYVADVFIKMMGTPDFITNFEKIKNETLAAKENAANLESAQAMLDFIYQGHLQNMSFKPLATNLYERISFAADFQDGIKNKPFQVQMTLDKSIAFKLNSTGQMIQAYQQGHSVVEVKVPVEYAKYDLKSRLDHLPGYQDFLQFVEQVKKDHLPEYMPGVGKMGHGHRGFKGSQTANVDFD